MAERLRKSDHPFLKEIFTHKNVENIITGYHEDVKSYSNTHNNYKLLLGKNDQSYMSKFQNFEKSFKMPQNKYLYAPTHKKNEYDKYYNNYVNTTFRQFLPKDDFDVGFSSFH